MTIWQPDLTERTGPKYQAIANALAEDIARGALPADARLPTHRDLAWRLEVTVGTVSRAYALAQSWGLIAGEVGRGTRVRPGPYRRTGGPGWGETEQILPRDTSFFFPATAPGAIEMSRNYPKDERLGTILAEGMKRIADPETLWRLGEYMPPNGAVFHRQAGVDWMKQFGLDTGPEEVLIVNGCQHGLSVAFSALARPGDVVLMESLTWPGAKRLATMLGLQTRSLPLDEHGLMPDAFEEACRDNGVRVLYTVPTLQNPTVSVMPEERRREIARIARANGVTIFEDDVFGFLASDAPPPIAAIAPDVTVYATSLSKSVTPALRAGYLIVPPPVISKFASVIQSTMIMLPTLGSHLAAELVTSGAAAEMAERQRQTAARGQRSAARILHDQSIDTHPGASQFWLHLPAQWRSDEFVSEALARGVAVTPGGAFAVETSEPDPRAVRVCLCSEPDGARIEEGLEVLASLLASHPGAMKPMV